MYTLKKSLGQHFLKDENICRKIVAVVQEKPFERLLEIGPGGGALTKYLLQIPGIGFKAVELDNEKVDYLLQTYPHLAGKVINDSFLKIEKPFDKNFTVVGNFPYNISSQILFKILEWTDAVDCVTGMFQKEVAVRIAAKEGNKDYGILSVLIQAYFKVEYLFEVHENCFVPPPKVKSAVIRLTNTHNPYNINDQRKLFLLVKTAFGQRRKQLRNPLKKCFAPEFLKDDIFTRRAEDLTVRDYVDLMKQMI
ncbi:MAG: 16S rRNA (adenine(1518)-N(6)/adenine(1519)-N(6))-dimethyltransferase RsmA [Chitinophagaceae bacterium]|nr:16S rRNA (adenine(1518)-N(6)/adenine(1519)-N(6))-dimethyltransferase RsmA [Chitinophagaceae bacterium]